VGDDKVGLDEHALLIGKVDFATDLCQGAADVVVAIRAPDEDNTAGGHGSISCSLSHSLSKDALILS